MSATAVEQRRSPAWIGPALLGALIMNVGLFSLVTLMTHDGAPPQDITEPAGVSLVTLTPPEPPAREEVKKPKPPEPEPKMDFAPDLTPPPLDLGGPSFDAGIAIDLGGMNAGQLEEKVVFDAYELDQAPQTVVRVPPVYPYAERERGIEGIVQVKLLVNVDGTVGEVKILDARPAGSAGEHFKEAVRNTVPKWKFEPGKLAGESVTSWVITNVEFDLN